MAEKIGNSILWYADELVTEVEWATAKAMAKGANIVAKEARRLAPEGDIDRKAYKTGKYAGKPWTARRTGTLRKNIYTKRAKRKVINGKWRNLPRKWITYQVLAGSVSAYYARFAHYGVMGKVRKDSVNAGKRYPIPGYDHPFIAFMVDAVDHKKNEIMALLGNALPRSRV